MSRFRFVLLPLLVCALPLFGDQPAASALAFNFTAAGVTVSGASPRAAVYLYSLAREPRGYYTSVVQRDVQLVDSDGDGAVTWTFAKTVPPRSVWLAVDLSTGAAAVASLPGYPAVRQALDSNNLKNAVGDEIGALGAAGSLVAFIVVRPADGVWGAAVGSRGPIDEGSENGKVTISAANLQPRLATAAAAPAKLKKGDVVFLINTFDSAYGMAIVGQK